MKIAELLDCAKKGAKVRTDLALAARLGVTRQTVSGWRSGVRHPDPVSCAKLAHLCEFTAAQVLAWVNLERATDPDERAAWRAVGNS